MCVAKREARLLLISPCEGSELYVALVFRGPQRIEYASLGTWDSVEKFKNLSIFDEIRYGWPEEFAKRMRVKPLPSLEEYFGSCLACVKNFIKTMCNISDSLIVYNSSLHFRSLRENNKRSQYLGERATG